jgi:hypothetical protein
MDTQDQIVAAAKRMQDAGVIIDCEPADDWLDIDATSLDGLSNEVVFFLEGEAAANLISEAMAYADGVSFDEALAFVVEGFLENQQEGPAR